MILTESAPSRSSLGTMNGLAQAMASITRLCFVLAFNLSTMATGLGECRVLYDDGHRFYRHSTFMLPATLRLMYMNLLNPPFGVILYLSQSGAMHDLLDWSIVLVIPESFSNSPSRNSELGH